MKFIIVGKRRKCRCKGHPMPADAGEYNFGADVKCFQAARDLSIRADLMARTAGSNAPRELLR